MTFNLTLKEKGDDFAAMFDAIGATVEHATFTLSPEGITFRGMDPSHVALIDLDLKKEGFDEYECDKEQRFEVHVPYITNVLKRMDKNDSVNITLTETNTMVIKLGARRKYEIRLGEAGPAAPDLPKVEYDNQFTITGTELNKILNDVKVVAEYMQLTAKDNQIEIAGKGDGSSVNIVLDSEQIQEVKTTKDGTTMYSLEYLLPIVKIMGSRNIVLEYSGEKPVRATTNMKFGAFTYFLAPRVQN